MRSRQGEERARQARLRWDRENIEFIGARFSKEQARMFHKLCQEYGISAYRMVKAFVRECLKYGSLDFFVVPVGSP